MNQPKTILANRLMFCGGTSDDQQPINSLSNVRDRYSFDKGVRYLEEYIIC